jgi:hypothetical protein
VVRGDQRAEHEPRALVGEVEELLDRLADQLEPGVHRRHPEDQHGQDGLEGHAGRDRPHAHPAEVGRERGGQQEERRDAEDRLPAGPDGVPGQVRGDGQAGDPGEQPEPPRERGAGRGRLG